MNTSTAIYLSSLMECFVEDYYNYRKASSQTEKQRWYKATKNVMAQAFGAECIYESANKITPVKNLRNKYWSKKVIELMEEGQGVIYIESLLEQEYIKGFEDTH
jgi:hypothetical protein